MKSSNLNVELELFHIHLTLIVQITKDISFIYFLLECNEFLLIVLLNTQNKRGTNIYAVASIEVLLGAFFLILGKRKEKRDSKDTYFGNLKKERHGIR